MSRKGWISIVEAFTMILLITGILLIILNGESFQKDSSQEIYEEQQGILREIQLNDSLRNDILNSINLPVEWEELTGSVKNKIISKTPGYLECKAKICNENDVCVLNENSDKEVFVQKVIITSTLDTYSPRQLKLFCWR